MVIKGTVAPELYLKNLSPQLEYPGLLLLLQLLQFSALIRVALVKTKFSTGKCSHQYVHLLFCMLP